jgi:uncharacterized membrane protein
MAAWTITWGEHTWAEGDLTGEHLVLMQIGANQGWNIEPTDGPVQLIATIAACVALEQQRPIADVIAEVRAVPASELISALTIA